MKGQLITNSKAEAVISLSGFCYRILIGIIHIFEYGVHLSAWDPIIKEAMKQCGLHKNCIMSNIFQWESQECVCILVKVKYLISIMLDLITYKV